MKSFPSIPWPVGLMAVAVLSLTGIFAALELVDHLWLSTAHSAESHMIKAAIAALVSLTACGWYAWRSRQLTILSPAAGTSSEDARLDSAERTRQHARWFVQLRWFAAATIFILVIGAVPLAHLLPPETLVPLLGWWLVLVAANVAFSRWADQGSNPERQVLIQVFVDLVILTGLLNASGGIENPIYIAYLFHVIIGGILLPRRKAWWVSLAACLLFTALALGELLGVVPHRTIVLFPHETGTASAHDHADSSPHEHGESVDLHASHDPMFVLGRVVPFNGVLALCAYLTTLVSERLRRSEQDLAELARNAVMERQRLEGVVDAAGVGMILMAPDLSVQWCSHRAAEWFGWDSAVIDRRCPIANDHDRCSDCLVARTFETGQPLEMERQLIAPDGAVRHFRHATSPVLGEDNRPVQVVELVEEVTARKALEAEAAHAGKLSLLGRMAAGIAHEIGNPLSSISTRLKLIERRKDPGFIDQSMAVLRSQIDRIGQIVHGVSQFARPQGSSWTLCNANEVVREVADVVSLGRRAKNITLRWELSDQPLYINGVRDQIVQVVLNLVLNSLEATPDGGEVTIVTIQQNGEVAIEVSDNGIGMDESVKARIFEPFFTTKEQGSGLGLSISYSLVHAHGGHIEVTTKLGRGSSFVVSLPAAGPTQKGPGRKRG